MKQGKILSENYYEAFKNLYYHLYSNSSASRAERIISDLSKLLLVSLSSNNKRYKKLINDFLSNGVTANDSLLPIIKEIYSDIFDDNDRFGIDDNSLKLGVDAL